jgi:hypothetical protein
MVIVGKWVPPFGLVKLVTGDRGLVLHFVRGGSLAADGLVDLDVVEA